MNLPAIGANQLLRSRETLWSVRAVGRYGYCVIAIAIAMVTFACAPAPSASAAIIANRIYAQTFDGRGSAGATITGEMTQLELTESADPILGRSASPGTLRGWLVLRNGSAAQIVRIIGVNIRYIDSSDRPIALGAGRSTAALRMATTQLSFEPLEPGEAVKQIVHVEIPTTRNLKEVWFEFSYAVSPATEGNYPPRDDREHRLRFVVPIARG